MDEEIKNNGIGDRINEFVKTPQGRVAAIAGASALLFIVLFFVFLAIFSAGNKPDADSKIVKPVVTEEQTSDTVDGRIDNGEEDSDDEFFNSSFEVYQTRDPFKPIKTSQNSAATVVGTSASNLPVDQPAAQTTTETAQAAATSLALNSIAQQDGIPYANISYGGTAYTLKAGDRVGNSPYLVQQVGTNSVTLLYGDDQFTLQVGQEVFK